MQEFDIIDFVQNTDYSDAMRMFEEKSMKVKEFADKIVLVDYDQIASPRKDSFVDCFRGMIIDFNEHVILRRMYKRFYNYGECEETLAAFDFKNASLDEKLDGSCIGLWYNPYTYEWETGTRGTPYGTDEMMYTVKGVKKTYTQLFFELVDLSKYELDTNMTYIFELCSKYNECVVEHHTPKVYIHGILNNNTSSWDNLLPSLPHVFSDIERPAKYTFANVDAMIEYVLKLPASQEGIVMTDPKNLMMKVKSPLYILLHHTKTASWNTRKVLDVIVAGEIHELLSVVKDEEVIHIANDIEAKLKMLEDESRVLIEKYSYITDTREFADAVRDAKCKHILFGMRKNGQSFLQVIKGMTPNGRLRLLGYKE